MGHMNVRYYVARACDGLLVLLTQMDFAQRNGAERATVVRARDLHLRFSRELRAGAAFSIHAGVIADRSTPAFYEEIRTAEGQVATTAVAELSSVDLHSGAESPWSEATFDRLRGERVSVPEYAQVRSVDQHPTRRRISREHALALGMLPGFLGPVTADDCDSHDVMREAACMARISDGIAHVLHALYDDEKRPEGIGGAALEYRFVFHRWPRLNDAIEVRSGLCSLGQKTLKLTHYVFDVAAGDCVASAQAVIAWFDLTTRRAVAIPEGLRSYLRSKQIDGIVL
jgi:acyl-CoA thioester hydrolase